VETNLNQNCSQIENNLTPKSNKIYSILNLLRVISSKVNKSIVSI